MKSYKFTWLLWLMMCFLVFSVHISSIMRVWILLSNEKWQVQKWGFCYHYEEDNEKVPFYSAVCIRTYQNFLVKVAMEISLLSLFYNHCCIWMSLDKKVPCKKCNGILVLVSLLFSLVYYVLYLRYGGSLLVMSIWETSLSALHG